MKPASTQKFTEIVDIVDQVVLLSGGNAALVIEVQASNFALLSQEEQNAKIYAYASFLNSLSFPIQIVVRNKKIDISSYINLLNQQIKQTTLHQTLSDNQNQALISYIQLYRDFITELVKVNTVLDKNFYIIVSYSYLEKGTVNMAKGKTDSFAQNALAALRTKADGVLTQLSRLSLKARILEKEELVRLFYEIYNPNNPVSGNIAESTEKTVITGQKQA